MAYRDQPRTPLPTVSPSDRPRVSGRESTKASAVKFGTLSSSFFRKSEERDPAMGIRGMLVEKDRAKSLALSRANVASINNSVDLAKEQNDLLRQIIDAIKGVKSPGSTPDNDPYGFWARGRGGKPGRGRFGAEGRKRLERLKAAKAARPQIKPGYSYNEKTKRYRDTRTGKFVKSSEALTSKPGAGKPRVEPRIQVPKGGAAVPTTPETQTTRPAENERVGQRTVAGRNVTYNERAYNRTLQAVRIGGGVALVIGAMGIAQQVSELYALRQMNQQNSEEGITEEEFRRELSNLAGSVLGGVGGAYLGAKVGGLLGGATGGPWGALAGGVTGGIFGGMTGASAGDLIGAAIFDQLTGSNTFREKWNTIVNVPEATNLAVGVPGGDVDAMGLRPEAETVTPPVDSGPQTDRRTQNRMEGIIRALQAARARLNRDPNNRRLQQAVIEEENKLRNLLNDPSVTISAQGRRRASQFLQGQAEQQEPVTRVDEELVTRSSSRVLENLTETEYDEIRVEGDTVEFDGRIELPFSPVTINLATPAATRTMPMPSFGGGGGAQATPAAPMSVPSAVPSRTAPSMGGAIGGGGPGVGGDATAVPGGEPGDFMSEVNRVASRFGVNPSDLLALMRSESSLNPQAVNPTTGATGLIQFMPATARSLGTTTEAIRQMSAAEQMKYVEKFFESVRLPQGASAGQLYAYVFLPGRARRDVLTVSGEAFYEANRGLDMDSDGRITIADLDARMARFGGTTQASMVPRPGQGGAQLASASGGMAAADQAQTMGTGRQIIVEQAGQQQPTSQPGGVRGLIRRVVGEVPLNRRLERQVS